MSLVQECGAATVEFGGGMWWVFAKMEHPKHVSYRNWSKIQADYPKCEEDVKPRDSRCSGSSLSGHHLDLAWLSCCDKETPVGSQTKQN